MKRETGQSQVAATRGGSASQVAVRLHYLDWLRVLATLGVFMFHAINVFGPTKFEINNAERSDLILLIQGFFFPWGMPLFFLVSGAGSWFALRRRTAAQFTRERTLRLLVPFFTGTLLLGPVQLYLSWSHKSQTGVFAGSFRDFLIDRLPPVGPKYFGAFGYHMWFLGFLFAFSLLALPLFTWLKGESGRTALSRLAGLCERRGAILLFVLPVVLVRVCLHSFFPEQQSWADFFSHGTFFVLGYALFADARFLRAIRRDWAILLAMGTVAILAAIAIVASIESFDIEQAPRTPLEFLLWGFVAACGWFWTAFMLSIAMRHLDRDTKALRYGQATLLPFFVVHQPAILAVAYFVVQWEASITFKLVIVLLGAFALSIGLTELGIKRVRILRLLFGMKPLPKAPAAQPMEVPRILPSA
ncbi:MAG: acyltransferase [Anaerolineae bacterium]|nr:acyltransferase [Anaerolineae bacterium]